ncbi:pilus assembly PilX N-terminal domain-containing protein [Motiliproteus sediminis]|uniref:pilus assembly PilX N-terminal domain-containing protein n=1 Tax=Motiliproteus sediminis TaxID=1468178 RepID=UPI001AEF644D|nr:pilus assembly PilX N-terminal domain-containing protein [Motiliproteus sediminis]
MNASLTPNSSSLPNRQRGVVLVVCLLVIMVVTLIAATATKTSTYEEKMAANAQTYNRTFQAAESAVELAFTNETMMMEAIDASDSISSTTSTAVGSHGVVATASIRFRGEGIAPGNSIGTASTYMYEINGEGELDEMNTSTLIRQGFYRVSFVTSTNQ